jgi:hypothetical protein
MKKTLIFSTLLAGMVWGGTLSQNFTQTQWAVDSTFKRGWAQYAHHPTNAAQRVSGATNNVLQIDGGGSTSNTNYLPQGVDALWDTNNYKVISNEVGNGYNVRVQFTCDPVSISDDKLDVLFDIGGAVGQISGRTIGSPKGADPFTVSVAIPLFSLDTFVANGCSIYINPLGNDFDITDASILIQQTHSNGSP